MSMKVIRGRRYRERVGKMEWVEEKVRGRACEGGVSGSGWRGGGVGRGGGGGGGGGGGEDSHHGCPTSPPLPEQSAFH